MNTARLLKTTAWVAVFVLLASCGTHRGLGRRSGQGSSIEKTTKTSRAGRVSKTAKAKAKEAADQPTTAKAPAVKDTLQKEAFIDKVTDNAMQAHFITSKIKFSVEVGNQQMTLTGNLKMKRNDVIRLQLMAFGFVEAGRLEFTPEYVMIIDRINKQYLKVPYAQLEFMRTNGIDFYMLQALFWTELFKPGMQKQDGKVSPSDFHVEEGVDDDIILSIDNDKLSYRWLAERNTARVKMANLLYSDRFRGNYQLNWDYEDFKRSELKYFPMKHSITVTAPEKEVKFSMVLNYMGHDENWDTRTTLSGKYRQVEVDEILRRFMAL